MSYYDDSSLFLSPNGYKTSVLFAQKPMDANGQLAFTRSNDTATRVGPDGLIEKVRTNLVLQSQTFDNASWIKINATATANSTTAPDGTLTADTILAPLAISTAVYQTISSSGAMTFSLYAKANTSNFVFVEIFDAAPPVDYMAIFDLSNGTFIGNGGFGSVDSYSIENAGNGWYRLSVTKNVGAVGAHNYVVGVAKTGNSSTPVAGTSVFVWGAQVEASDFGATDYIATTTAAVSVGPVANVPRLDYLNSTCPRLLLEPQRTNVALNSETFGSSTGTTIVLNNGTSLDGYVNADKLVEDTSTGVHISSLGGALGGSVDSSVYSVSVFAKAAGRTRINMFDNNQAAAGSTNFDIANGVVISGGGKIENYGNGWYRCIIFPSKTNSTNANVQIRLIDTGTNVSYTGNGTSGVFLWGAQIEAGAYATSYIPTLAASVTRGTDAMSKSSYSCGITTEATLFADFEYQNTGSGYSTQFLIYNISAGNYIYLTVINNSIRAICVSAGVSQSNIMLSSTTAGTRYKVAARFKQNDFALYVNGTLVGTDTSGTMPTFGTSGVTSFIGNDSSSTEPAGYANQYIAFPAALSNSNLAALTA